MPIDIYLCQLTKYVPLLFILLKLLGTQMELLSENIELDKLLMCKSMLRPIIKARLYLDFVQTTILPKIPISLVLTGKNTIYLIY